MRRAIAFLFFAFIHCNIFLNSAKELNCPSIQPQNHLTYANSPTCRGEDPKYLAFPLRLSKIRKSTWALSREAVGVAAGQGSDEYEHRLGEEIDA